MLLYTISLKTRLLKCRAHNSWYVAYRYFRVDAPPLPSRMWRRVWGFVYTSCHGKSVSVRKVLTDRAKWAPAWVVTWYLLATPLFSDTEECSSVQAAQLLLKDLRTCRGWCPACLPHAVPNRWPPHTWKCLLAWATA